MQPFPHVYRVNAAAAVEGAVTLASGSVADLQSAAPREFDGPGDQWSPEALLCAAVASCFVLTFRAIARASKLRWQQLDCNVEGTLERVEGGTQFTRIVTHATLRVPPDVNVELCNRLLEKAEQGCLVANSLRSRRELQAKVMTVERAEAAHIGAIA
ncbi:MAG: OsmC family protein [Steroidobacteraceae bacterium]